MGENKNPHSDTLWESTKAEAGVVAACTVGGAALGFGVGTGIVAIAATPPIPTLAISTTTGGVVGCGVGVYAAHRLHEAEARAERYADAAIRNTIYAGKLPPVDRDAQLAAAFADAVKPQFKELQEGLKGVKEGLDAVPTNMAKIITKAA